MRGSLGWLVGWLVGCLVGVRLQGGRAVVVWPASRQPPHLMPMPSAADSTWAQLARISSTLLPGGGTGGEGVLSVARVPSQGPYTPTRSNQTEAW
jgi:hypothetical protein